MKTVNTLGDADAMPWPEGIEDVKLPALLIVPRDPGDGPAVSVPSIEQHPAVVESGERSRKLAADLDATRKELAQLETGLGISPKTTEQQLRAKALVQSGTDADVAAKFDRIRELRDRRGVLVEAVKLAADEYGNARDAVTRELSTRAHDDIFIPAARRFAKSYVAFVKQAGEFRNVRNAIEGARLSVPGIVLNADMLPVNNTANQLGEFFRGLVQTGLIEAEEVNEYFPGSMPV